MSTSDVLAATAFASWAPGVFMMALVATLLGTGAALLDGKPSTRRGRRALMVPAGVALAGVAGMVWFAVAWHEHGTRTSAAVAAYVREHNHLTAVLPVDVGQMIAPAQEARFDGFDQSGRRVHVVVSWAAAARAPRPVEAGAATPQVPLVVTVTPAGTSTH